MIEAAIHNGRVLEATFEHVPDAERDSRTERGVEAHDRAARMHEVIAAAGSDQVDELSKRRQKLADRDLDPA